ncbi:hypothetical protein BC830DRAFT_122851 [Chytriomyces sp. MP71]|nr:hypothetical protein BC830DRAFT_122851 [Chytriomyces sp. MP71]
MDDKGAIKSEKTLPAMTKEAIEFFKEAFKHRTPKVLNAGVATALNQQDTASFFSKTIVHLKYLIDTTATHLFPNFRTRKGTTINAIKKQNTLAYTKQLQMKDISVNFLLWKLLIVKATCQTNRVQTVVCLLSFVRGLWDSATRAWGGWNGCAKWQRGETEHSLTVLWCNFFLVPED